MNYFYSKKCYSHETVKIIVPKIGEYGLWSCQKVSVVLKWCGYDKRKSATRLGRCGSGGNSS